MSNFYQDRTAKPTPKYPAANYIKSTTETPLPDEKATSVVLAGRQVYTRPPATIVPKKEVNTSSKARVNSIQRTLEKMKLGDWVKFGDKLPPTTGATEKELAKVLMTRAYAACGAARKSSDKTKWFRPYNDTDGNVWITLEEVGAANDDLF